MNDSKWRHKTKSGRYYEQLSSIFVLLRFCIFYMEFFFLLKIQTKSKATFKCVLTLVKSIYFITCIWVTFLHSLNFKWCTILLHELLMSLLEKKKKLVPISAHERDIVRERYLKNFSYSFAFRKRRRYSVSVMMMWVWETYFSTLIKDKDLIIKPEEKVQERLYPINLRLWISTAKCLLFILTWLLF